MHPIARAIVSGIVSLLLTTVFVVTNASADQIPINDNATPSPTGNGIDSTVKSGTGSPGHPAGAGPSSNITCVYTPIAADFPTGPSASTGGVTTSGQVIAPNAPGTWAIEACVYSDGSPTGFPKWVFLPPGSAVSPVQLLQSAKNHLGLPAPPVQLSPAADHWQYVQMPTWAWIPANAWSTLTSTISAGAVSVTVVATPLRIVFAYQVKGDATTATSTCSGPGTPYSDQLAVREKPDRPVLAPSPDCGWTWQQSSADTPDQKYAVQAHTVYHAVWTISGAPGGGDLGELSGLNTDLRVTVGEIHALNTPPR